MQQTPGHVYGTGRPRLWDGIDGVRFVNGFHTPGVWVMSSGQLAGRFK